MNLNIRQARNVSNWSVVKLEDGRIGVLTHRTGSGKPHVKLSPEYAIEINKNTEVEVIVTPALLAMAYLESLEETR
jgi:hypothetical protein